MPGKAQAALVQQWRRREQPSVSLTLPYPPSTNRLWQRTRTGMCKSPRYATWFREAGNELAAQRPGKVTGPYSLTVWLGRPDRRARDLDNVIKSLSDLLVEHGVIDDDALASTITLSWSAGVVGAQVTIARAA